MKEKGVSKTIRGIVMMLIMCLVFPYNYLHGISVSDVLNSFGVDKAVSGTYGYANGVLVQKIDQTTGNKIIFDRGQFRAVVDKNGNVLSLAVYATDNVSSTEDLKKLVSQATGLSGEALDKLFKGIDDNGKEVALPTWLNEAISWLNKGTGYSINISFGEGGPSVTFSENGKEVIAKNFLGKITSQWIYNPDGSLAKVESLTYVHCDKDTRGAIEKTDPSDPKGKKKYYVKEVRNETIYSNGKPVSVYEVGVDGKKTLVGTYEYNSAGELLSYTDLKENQKTLYSAGKPFSTISLGGNLQSPANISGAATEVSESEAKNNGLKPEYFKQGGKYYKLKEGYRYDADSGTVFKIEGKILPGTVVTVWNYKANGALDTVEGRDKSGAWATTVFDAGRAIAVFNGRYSNGDALRGYVQNLINLAIQAAGGNQSAIKQLNQLHNTNVYGLKSLYLYNDQVKSWLSQYGAMTAQIIGYLFNWTNNEQHIHNWIHNEQYSEEAASGAAAAATINSIIETVKKFGFNGASLAAVANFSNTLSQSDNNNASFVASVTLYAAGQAVADINTSVLDKSYEELLANLGIDWSELNVAEVISALKNIEIENLIVAEYTKLLQNPENREKSEEEIKAIKAAIAEMKEKFKIAMLSGKSVDEFCRTLGLTNSSINIIMEGVSKINKKYAAQEKLFSDIVAVLSGQVKDPSKLFAMWSNAIKGMSQLLGAISDFVNYQLDTIQALVNLMPSGENDFYIVFNAADSSLTPEQLAKRNELESILASLGLPVTSGTNIFNQFFKALSPSIVTNDSSLKSLDTNNSKLKSLITMLSNLFNFDVSATLTLTRDGSSDWQKNALNVVWKTGMTKIINSLKTQLTKRLAAMQNCYSSGNLDGLKSLTSNIIATDSQVYSHDPSIAGTLQNIVQIDGKYYAVVSADYIDLMDGLGAQDAEGEVIYVEISAELAAQIKDKIGGSVMFMGDVAADTNGHLTITMNVEYGGGYRDLGNATKQDMKVAMDNLKSEAWYGKVLDQMKSIWADIRVQYGGYSTWRQGFEFLRDYATGGGSVANF